MYSDGNNDLLVNLSTYNNTVDSTAYGVPWRTDMEIGLRDEELSLIFVNMKEVITLSASREH